MQQKNNRRIGGAGLTVEQFQTIDVDRLVPSRSHPRQSYRTTALFS